MDTQSIGLFSADWEVSEISVLTDKSDQVPCTPDQNSTNLASAQLHRKRAGLAREALNYALAVDANSTDIVTFFDLARRVGEQPWSWSDCSPTFDVVNDAYREYAQAFNACRREGGRVIVQIYDNAARDLARLSELAEAVARERRQFNDAGLNGIPAIEEMHSQFWTHLQKVAAFRLETVTFRDRTYSAEAFYEEVQRIQRDESQSSTIDELDRLRDEYRQFNRARVPKRAEFTQISPSNRFSFAQMIGETPYSWAMLTARVATAADGIAADMEAQGWRVQLNSCYRNPARCNGESRHQYGDALDFQVFDFNADGSTPYDEQDWTLLRDFVQSWGPYYTEPIEESGAGHVHIDFRDGE